MKLTTTLIRQAASGIDSVAPEIEVMPHGTRRCAAVYFAHPGDLLLFGMSLAHVIGSSGDEFAVEGDELGLIDSALSEMPLSMSDGPHVLYWPSVPYEEVGQ